MFRLAIAAVFMGAATLAFSHSEYKARYVAENGNDQGQCDSPIRPCQTIAYAASKAIKGERVFVASGRYHIEDTSDVFYVTSGTVQVFGGYNRYEHFQKQQAEQNPTVLSGVPAQYRAQLEAKGFRLIADGKSLAAKTQANLDAFVKTQARIKTSKNAAPCVNGQADGFQCNNLGLLSQISLTDLGAQGPNQAANDIWGFVDLNTEREYAIIGYNVGTAVVEVTDPENPVIIGRISGQNTVWRDIKVYQFYDQTAQRFLAYAYVTADSANDGIVIIDLTELPNRISLANRVTLERSAHNVYISNVDYSTGLEHTGLTPVLYTAGADLSNGAFRGYGLSNPTAPTLLEAGNRGYMHDASSFTITDSRKDTQCANATATSCDVLIDFNESSFQLWDVTNVNNPVLLSERSYGNAAYVHSGWWSEDRRYLFVQDELDEGNNNLNTTLRVFDLNDLLNPVLASVWTGPSTAIDHNGFVRGNRYYMSNYERGITVLDISDPTNLQEVGFFDTIPNSNRAAFNGSWGAYPYLPSGNILLSDDIGGLFVLSDDTLASDAGQLGFDATSYAVEEGQTLSLPVNRSGSAVGAVSVDYWILNGSTAADDVSSNTRGTLTWANGDSAPKSIDINTSSDGNSESLERLFVRLENPQGSATLANTATTVFLHEPGAATQVDFLNQTEIVTESDPSVELVIKRLGSAQGLVTVDYQTLANTATANSDYTETSGQLTWPDGDATGRTISIPILRDTEQESDESFSLTLSSPIGATLVSQTATVTISSANQAPVANAGANISVNENSQTTLDGSQSTDPDGDTLSYDWSQLSGSVQLSLSNTDSAMVTINAPEVTQTGSATLQLEVTDQSGLSATDTVVVTVTNISNPNANPGGGGGGGNLLWLIGVIALLGFSRFGCHKRG